MPAGKIVIFLTCTFRRFAGGTREPLMAAMLTQFGDEFQMNDLSDFGKRSRSWSISANVALI